MQDLNKQKKSSIARSVLYIVYSGGLLTFCAIIFQKVCANNCFGIVTIPDFNFLESAGLLSFTYIIIFGLISFVSPKIFATKSQPTNLHKNDKIAHHTSNDKRENVFGTMKKEDKEQLRKIIAKKYGFEERS